MQAERLSEERVWDFLLNKKPLPEKLEFGGASFDKETKKIWKFYAYVPTLEGRMMADIGDWIITGVKGEKYPCKPDIFQETYEVIENE